MFRLLIITTLAFCATTILADVSNSGSWSRSPFDQKVFIENKGQFDGKSGTEQKNVLFGAFAEGVDIYFGQTGVTYRHDDFIPIPQQEQETSSGEDEAGGEKEDRGRAKFQTQYLSIEWAGANSHPEIIVTNPVSSYYTYEGVPKTLLAHAWKKLIYKNLYPNIDIEYTFPENKEGVKYSVIVHPGGDVSAVTMKYHGAKNLRVDERGNVEIKSSFGDFIDHFPVTTIDDGEIASSFALNDTDVSFRVSSYDKSKSIIIDPWITNPAFTGANKAFDVNYDLAGNVYIYGSYAPFKLAKLDSSGSLQWIFNATNFGLFGNYYYYGDFAVDETSGTSYLVEGLHSPGGARVFKVSSNGIQTGTFKGNSDMDEMWRAEYNHCLGKIVIAAGSSAQAYQAAMLDTNMVDIKPVNVLSTNNIYHDFALLAVDNNSNYCYMATAHSSNDGSLSNILVKCPLPNFIPLAFSVPDGYRLQELGSANYVPRRYANGINGIDLNSDCLYTYDGDSLKRWNKNTGVLTGGIHISPMPPTYNYNNPSSYKAITVLWGGLAVDECNNIYVGCEKFIKEYDRSLALIHTFSLPDTVFDVKLGIRDKLYACGKSFVTQINLPKGITISVSQTPSSACDACDGIATVKVNTVCPKSISPFSYLWNTTPVQTTQTATGLCPGTYKVTATTRSNCYPLSYTDSVTVEKSGALKLLSTTIGAKPGDEIYIPILLDPSTKYSNTKEINLTVKYDPALLHFENVTSPLGTVLQMPPSNGVLSFTIPTNGPFPTPTATIAELHLQALLAPYTEGKIEITSSTFTLGSGEQITAAGCPVVFSLDSSCIKPGELQLRSSAVIEGIYPNPSTLITTVNILARANPRVRVDVFDTFGRRVETVFDGEMANGNNELTINTQKYFNGIYFCRLTYRDSITTSGFNVQR